MISDAHKKELEATAIEVLVKRRTKVFERIKALERQIKQLEREKVDQQDTLAYIMKVMQQRYENGETEAK